MRITTLPVYSKLADRAEVAEKIAPNLPVQLSQHQLETYRALCDNDVDIVINTAMTGDGKSLAGLLPLLMQNCHTLALYPTNELIRDQHQSATRLLPHWSRTPDAISLDLLFGARLDDIAEEAEFGARGDHLITQLKNHQLVLSNPDIFHAILQFSYQQGRAPDWIAGQLVQQFSQLTFDEFHIFDIPQVASMLTGLLYLYEQKGGYPLKILFLSATPGDVLVPLLERAGFAGRMQTIDGMYCHGEPADPERWRPILQPTTLHFADQPIDAWLDVHLEDRLLAFFRQHGKGAKGAIIVNSVATAHQLLGRLQQTLEPEVRVLPNTGLTGRKTKEDSRHADLLIGTSTVDVGVDFQINFLVFESSDAGTFIQRLGRLGRHRSYTDADGEPHTFTQFEAHALLPPFIYQRLFQGYQGAPPALADGQVVQRDTLNNAVRVMFPSPTKYDFYLQDWGKFQPWHVLAQLSKAPIRTTYADLIQRLSARYQHTFRTSMKSARMEAEDYKKSGIFQLIEEARSFRGCSPFECGVLLDGEPEPLRYDLFWLLANADVLPMARDAFCDEVCRRGYSAKPFEHNRVVSFFHALRLRPERAEVRVELSRARDIDWSPETRGVAQVISGVQVDCAVAWDLNDLNRHLRGRKFAATLVPGYHPLDLRRELWLPVLFPMHRYASDSGEGTIAFGRQALILDSILRRRKLRNSADEAIIC
jgi:CRISPR-associated endonuclease/helicase Cas3